MKAALMILGFIVVTVLINQCGQKKSQSTPDPSSAYVPSDWDGQSDWSPSSFEFTEL